MNKTKLLTDESKLRLDLQFFADSDDDTSETDVDSTEDDTEDIEDENTDGGDKTFTQEDIDRIVESRLARERKKIKEAEDKKKLEDQGKYKELYEETQAQLAEITRKSLLTSAMLKAGYSEDQIERYSKYIEGEDETEIEESVKVLVEDISPVSVKETTETDDPSPYPPRKKEVGQKDGTEYGRQAYERIKKRNLGGK